MNEHARPVQAATPIAPPPPAGHNLPTPINWARETIAELSEWMADHPTVQTEEDARAAKLLVDRAQGAVDAVEAERDSKVRPLNTQVGEINAEYKALHNPDGKKSGKWGLFDRVFNELKARLAAYLQAEEDKRIAAAQEKQRIADEAEQSAREADAREREAIENARVGEIGADVFALGAEADTAFRTFEHAAKAAEVAQIDTRVRVGGGFSKPIGLRNSKTLVVTDLAAAIAEIGPTAGITEAVLTAARAYKKLRGKYPKGIREENERVL
jgi:hypothetical protein